MSNMSYESILKVKEAYEGELLKREGVHGVAIGYKVENGVTTEQLAIITLTSSKKDKSLLSDDEIIPPSFDGIPTDVVEMPEILPIPDLPIKESNIKKLAIDNKKYRPIPGGAEIFMMTAPGRGGIGTLGMFAHSTKQGDTKNDVYLLSNAHCFPNPKQEIRQPASVSAADIVAVASRIVNSEKVDGGIAKMTDRLNADILNVTDIGRPCGTYEIAAKELGARVIKRGRTTETTRGYIKYIEVTANDKKHQIMVVGDTVFADGGDSGSVVFLQEGDHKNYVIGLLWGAVPADKIAVFSPVKAVESELDIKLITSDIGLSYCAHVMNNGWLGYVKENQIAGTTGESRRLEAVKIKLTECKVPNARIKYRVHVMNNGWLGYVYDDAITGTTGESRRAEAIQIELENLPGYSVVYRVHMQDKAWSDWVCDGAVAGTTGEFRRIEAIQAYIYKK